MAKVFGSGGTQSARNDTSEFDAEGLKDDMDLRAEISRLTRENHALRISVAELERIVDRDTLTPLFNRRYFINELIKRKALLNRHKVQTALLFVDVDNLKAINDAHGHAGGDFALIEIARRLAENVRSSDIVARIGGDEFAMLLDHVTESSMLKKTEKLGVAVSFEPANYNGALLNLSASIGGIMITPDESESDLLARADREMYRIKSSRD